jgi:hypothetical protein
MPAIRSVVLVSAARASAVKSPEDSREKAAVAAAIVFENSRRVRVLIVSSPPVYGCHKTPAGALNARRPTTLKLSQAKGNVRRFAGADLSANSGSVGRKY